MEKENQNENSRRNFLKGSLIAGAAATAAGAGLFSSCSKEEEVPTGAKVKLLSPDGKLVEVDSSHLQHCGAGAPPEEARKGIPGKKFVMVIDLSRCKHALKCEQACKAAHHLQPGQDWIKVFRMQDSKNTAPYWMPKPCMHCDNSPCQKVCPPGATFKRSDGIVLIDTERCIGCRFCMVACPYSSRVFTWGKPDLPKEISEQPGSPETGFPPKMGTVSKCDFCPDLLKEGKLPHCVSACPNGVYYFGDINEDAVTNGDETLRFSELIRDKGGYRLYEHLGTRPSVYYLPPVHRIFPFKEAEEEGKS
ncbi:MAG: 4Fe-4S dicluster domain-containing protein [Bacteroidetes bacterium]|nr:4Fe-4S dicluster domain-containing protein [Bacteroidota bacterium]